jgi:hypothetical protein
MARREGIRVPGVEQARTGNAAQFVGFDDGIGHGGSPS